MYNIWMEIRIFAVVRLKIYIRVVLDQTRCEMRMMRVLHRVTCVVNTFSAATLQNQEVYDVYLEHTRIKEDRNIY